MDIFTNVMDEMFGKNNFVTTNAYFIAFLIVDILLLINFDITF